MYILHDNVDIKGINKDFNMDNDKITTLTLSKRSKNRSKIQIKT